MTIYISGPISGNPAAAEQFEAAAARIEDAGHSYINPEKLREVFPDVAYHQAMSIDLMALMICADAICMLPGWESSQGALAEYAKAREYGLPVLTLKEIR